MDQKKIQTKLDAYLDRVKSAINPNQVILFGSFAQGRATKWSDIDLLVVAPFKRIPQKKRFDILYDLHAGLIDNHDFHVYGVTPEEYKVAPPWHILSEIKKSGKSIYHSSSNHS